MKMELSLESGKSKGFLGLEVYRDGAKWVDSLEWWSAVASLR